MMHFNLVSVVQRLEGMQCLNLQGKMNYLLIKIMPVFTYPLLPYTNSK